MSRHRQKGKGGKRRKSWHRGRGEARRWADSQLPDMGTGADPTSGAPRPLRRGSGNYRNTKGGHGSAPEAC